MEWFVTNSVDKRASLLADRHYSRKTIGASQFCPPGRHFVLITKNASALWVTSWPFPEYVHRDFKEAWNCSLFRNEKERSHLLSSDLIVQAISATRWKYGEPPKEGMITMIDAKKIVSNNPGYCYKKVGFRHVSNTKRGLLILQLLPENMPRAEMPNGVMYHLFD